MHRFALLYSEIDETNRTTEKVAAMVHYFTEANPRDAAWALYFLTGQKMSRSVSSALLWQWIGEETGLAPWIIGECYDAVGDAGETLSLLLPDNPDPASRPLHEMVEGRLIPMRAMSDEQKREVLVTTWNELNQQQRLVWNKLITGSFRVGVAKTLVIRALSRVAHVDPPVMAHRLMGQWRPTAEDYQRIMSGESHDSDTSRPYPFYLAYQVEQDLEALESPSDWQFEWKWDGIRAQLIRRGTDVMLWSRGEDLMTDRFPEVSAIGAVLPPGTVLDGEILAWRDELPLPFGDLQKRIGRKSVSDKLMAEVPVIFMAYDILESAGVDIRSLPIRERRTLLEELVHTVTPYAPSLKLSRLHDVHSWDEVRAIHASARAHLAEGLMLKRTDSPYGVGRVKGDWWKWKSNPFTIDAVLIYAERGHGRRASLHTDYTFGVWNNDELVPVAKAYSGLTDAEIAQADKWIRANTLEKFGPVRVVKPELVFEVAFEGIQESTRHKSGIAVRFPRIASWRHDKTPAEADTLENMKVLLRGLRGV